ncbi:YesL family protein [Bacillus infantis]|uniref:YesL family protein n=1 Tax=Bacillus infantis TaxID=324767 RepID=UPI002006651F|nr:YesL family protein [Bacillus infantis]MCK6206151.1 YesL family protein [Bacillus infantis]
MTNNPHMDGLYKFCLMFVRLAYVNLLWIFFTLLGAVFLGFFPSTAAMFAIVRQWIKGNKDLPLFQTYWNTFKKEFVKANMIGAAYFGAGIILYIDILYFSSPANIGLLILYYFFWVTAFLYLLLGTFLFPVYVHYQAKWWQYFKSTFMIMLMNPLAVLAHLAILIGVAIILRALPGLLPLFAGSAMAYALTLVSFKAFSKVEALTKKGVSQSEKGQMASRQIKTEI